jgi:hypothetical protein
MTLTTEQRRALEKGESVALDIDGTPCIVIRKDVYDEERTGDGPRTFYPAVLNALDRDDESPEQYLEYLDE